MKVKGLILGILLLVIMTGILIANRPSAVSASPNNQNYQRCECVDYAVGLLFDFKDNGERRRVSGRWEGAKDLANPLYWQTANRDYPEKIGAGTVKETNGPQVGDIIIMQPEAKPDVLIAKEGNAKTITPIGRVYDVDATGKRIKDANGNDVYHDYGHIGQVKEVNYYPNLKGWVIRMRSANWGDRRDINGNVVDNIFTVNTLPASSPDASKCNNVVDSWIFVRETDTNISFWKVAPPDPTPVPPKVSASVPQACVAPPTLFDPPNGRTFPANNTILQWKDYELKDGESFDIQARPDGGGWRTLPGEIKYKNGVWSLAVNDLSAWGRGTYFWQVRIKSSDGTYRSCDTGNVFSFTLTVKESPSQPSSSSTTSSSSYSSSSSSSSTGCIWFYGCTPWGCYWQCN